MSCPYYQYLSPYSDGELDSLKAEKVKEHLVACAFCRRELNLMLQIRNSLKQGAASTKAPPLLKEKILGESRQARRSVIIPRWNFAYAATLAATVLFAFILIFNLRQADRDSPTDIVDIMVKYHAAHGPGGKSLSIEPSDSKDAESWFKRKLGLEFSVPNAAFAGYQLKGADTFEQRGIKFAYLKYQRDGNIIGYIIFKDMAFSLDQAETVAVGKIKLQIGKKKETNMGVWEKDGLIYLILTTEARSELLEYARRCIQLF